MQGQIEDAAYREAQRQTTGDSVVVGVNRFTSAGSEPVPVLEVDPGLEEAQKSALQQRRARRDQDEVHATLAEVKRVAATDGNLMMPIKRALAAGATVGEVSDALRQVFGLYRPTG